MPFWGPNIMTRSNNRADHIRLTSHPAPGAKPAFPIHWGAATARERGPVIGTVSRPQDRNVIGTHGGSYSIYRALAVSSGALDPIRRPGPAQYPSGGHRRAVPAMDRSASIVSLDPWGHLVAENFAAEIAEGIDIRPDHRHHPRPARSARTAGRHRRRPAQARRRRGAQERQHLGGQDRHRSGVVPARHGASASPPARTICAARCSSRPAACSRNW